MILMLLCLFMLANIQAIRPDDVSSFFLKAPKSVPRAGRSAPNAYESFFVKASKSLPRVGRRDGVYPLENENQFLREPNFMHYRNVDPKTERMNLADGYDHDKNKYSMPSLKNNEKEKLIFDFLEEYGLDGSLTNNNDLNKEHEEINYQLER